MRPLKLFSAFVVLAAHYLAFAQVQPHGTIVVTYFSDDQIAMAADSRGSFNNYFLPPNDKQCKLAALGEQIIFASVGTTGWETTPRDVFTHRFENTEEAVKAFRFSVKDGERDILNRTARAWKEHLASEWKWLAIFNPADVFEAAKRGNGKIAQGLFAGRTEDGKLALIEVNIALDMRRWMLFASDGYRGCPRHICATGQPDIAIEYRDELTPRARTENQRWAKERSLISSEDIPSAEAVRLVRLTIEQSESVEVGGEIDVITLTKDGSIRWGNHKENCPENQD